ncbi:MAG: haloalkane dehalogenase [Acidimicrobiales bacterium]
MPLSSDFPYSKRKAGVEGLAMAYVDEGEGRPIVLLHGNPTSSYLWRNVIPYLLPFGRCVAPDLIGMGDSDKLTPSGPDAYRFVEHRRYLDTLLAQLLPEPDQAAPGVVLVVHDWGSALGFDWAQRHQDRYRIAGIVYMEAIVRPLAWSEWLPQSERMFRGLRSDAGEDMVLARNLFIERILTGSVGRGLTEEELATYRRPFDQPGEGRRPTLTWPRQIPLDGEPADVTAIVASYAAWLATSEIPKLFINADPGAILLGTQREFCRSWPNQQEVTVSGGHFPQEESPDEIGRAIATWLGQLAS